MIHLFLLIFLPPLQFRSIVITIFIATLLQFSFQCYFNFHFSVIAIFIVQFQSTSLSVPVVVGLLTTWRSTSDIPKESLINPKTFQLSVPNNLNVLTFFITPVVAFDYYLFSEWTEWLWLFSSVLICLCESLMWLGLLTFRVRRQK